MSDDPHVPETGDPLDPRLFHPDGRPKQQPRGDYAVGFARTDPRTRFQKNGGPRKGRKKGSRNLKTIWNEQMESTVKGMLDGKPVKLTRRQAQILNFFDKAQKSSSAKGASLPLEFDLKINGPGDDAEVAQEALSPVEQLMLAQLQEMMDAGFAGMEPPGSAGAEDNGEDAALGTDSGSDDMDVPGGFSAHGADSIDGGDHE